MRLLLLVCLIASFASAKLPWQHPQPPAPKILNIQINRCPTSIIYNNVHEEESTAIRSLRGKSTISSVFDETIRLEPNATGTMQFFVVGRGSFDVNITSDPKVFEGLHGIHHVENNQEGAVFSLPFKVLKSARESVIVAKLKTWTIFKTTNIYVSTNSLEPPRPPMQYVPVIFSPEEMPVVIRIQNNSTETSTLSPQIDVTPPPGETPKNETNGSDKNVTISTSTIEIVEFPTVDEILNGRYSNITSKSLRLDSIVLNRLTANKKDSFKSKINVYRLTIKKFEKGQIVFYVSGKGNKKVTVKSIAEPKMPSKVMKVADKYAAFAYTDGVDYVEVDRILVKVENDLKEKLFFYLVMTRVD